MKILDKIIDNKKKEIEKSKIVLPLSKIKKRLIKPTRSFYRCLKGRHNIIAELKFSSPSSGLVQKPSKKTIKEIISQYDCYASAISVLTDKRFFSGDLRYIKEVKKHTKLPILRKEFIIDAYQIYESRYYGADAILLIASILSKADLCTFISLADKLGLDCLVETRDRQDIRKGVAAKAKIIGINNRDLSSDRFDIDLNTTLKLKSLIPKHILTVSESGINTKKDILKLDTNSVLIGSSLMRSKNILHKLSQLHRTKVKICGITNIKDAKSATKLGADLLGFNFYKKSPRYITPTKAKQIIKTLPNTIQVVGIFVNHSEKQIRSILKTTGIDFIQLHGRESTSFTKKIQDNDEVIRAVRVKKSLPKPSKTFAQLYDTYNPKSYGGTGKTFNLDKIKDSKGKIFIAGGLDENNMIKTISALHPFAVDICSGVESSPGKKSYSKMGSLITKVKNYED